MFALTSLLPWSLSKLYSVVASLGFAWLLFAFLTLAISGTEGCYALNNFRKPTGTFRVVFSGWKSDHAGEGI